jgi:hypothetical protein
MKTTPDTVTSPVSCRELNEIHEAWMSLEADAPQAEKARVFAMMEKMPLSCIAATPDLRSGIVMLHGLPIWSCARPIGEAVAYLKNYATRSNKTRFDVVWVGSKRQWAQI